MLLSDDVTTYANPEVSKLYIYLRSGVLLSDSSGSNVHPKFHRA